jgi:hypothetical protein
MKPTDGSLSSPIWLLADSNPAKWQDDLDVPLEARSAVSDTPHHLDADFRSDTTPSIPRM